MRAVPEENIEQWAKMRLDGMTVRAISERTKTPESTISMHLSRRGVPSQVYDASKWEAAYERPTSIDNDDRRHLALLYQANGYGFTWISEAVAERFYALENAPALGREFWRAP